MNRARSLAMAIALAVAFVAVLMVKNSLNKPQVAQVIEREVSEVQVLVASKDMMLGDKVRPDSLEWVNWPMSHTEGFIRRDQDPRAKRSIDGQIVKASIVKGDPIRLSRLVKQGEAGVIAALLPSGKRAITIEFRSAVKSSGIIMPNDRVDVVQTIKSLNKNSSIKSKTVLENIRVLAVDNTLQQKEKEKTLTNRRTATLELTPKQVETLTATKAKGGLWLSLRSLQDINKKAVIEEEKDNSTIQVIGYGMSKTVETEN